MPRPVLLAAKGIVTTTIVLHRVVRWFRRGVERLEILVVGGAGLEPAALSPFSYSDDLEDLLGTA